VCARGQSANDRETDNSSTPLPLPLPREAPPTPPRCYLRRSLPRAFAFFVPATKQPLQQPRNRHAGTANAALARSGTGMRLTILTMRTRSRNARPVGQRRAASGLETHPLQRRLPQGARGRLDDRRKRMTNNSTDLMPPRGSKKLWAMQTQPRAMENKRDRKEKRAKEGKRLART
jgi:hypothetical protein